MTVAYNNLRNVVYNNWVIPSCYKQYFTSLYLLKWKVSYLISKIDHGILNQNGVDYYVVYKQPFGLQGLRMRDKVWLSFREPTTSIHPVVLISAE